MIILPCSSSKMEGIREVSFEATWREQYPHGLSVMFADTELHLPVQAIAAKLSQQGILGRVKVVLSSASPDTAFVQLAESAPRAGRTPCVSLCSHQQRNEPDSWQ